jgi:hypothetical protein
VAASIDIKVEKPQAGATVWGSPSGVNFDVSGTITVSSAPQVYDAEVWVRLGSAGTMNAAQINGNQWTYSRPPQ